MDRVVKLMEEIGYICLSSMNLGYIQVIKGVVDFVNLKKCIW